MTNGYCKTATRIWKEKRRWKTEKCQVNGKIKNRIAYELMLKHLDTKRKMPLQSGAVTIQTALLILSSRRNKLHIP